MNDYLIKIHPVEVHLACKMSFLSKAREGNGFRSVCQSLCSRGRGLVSLPVWSHVLPRRYDVTSCLVPCSVQRGSAPRGGCLLPGPQVLTSSGSHCSGWYASYWSTFLILRFDMSFKMSSIFKSKPVGNMWKKLETESTFGPKLRLKSQKCIIK